MRLITISVLLAASLTLAGCASTRSDGGNAGTAASAPVAPPRLATAVTVPAASARTVVLTMTGPKNVVEAKDWADFKREWRDTFADHAKAAGITFRFAEGDAKPEGQDGTLLQVTVADYRMVGIGARIMFGIMTGNAYIDAKVRYLSLRDGSVFGEQQYNTSSSAGAGVFAKVTPQQVDQITGEIVRDLKAAR